MACKLMLSHWLHILAFGGKVFLLLVYWNESVALTICYFMFLLFFFFFLLHSTNGNLWMNTNCFASTFTSLLILRFGIFNPVIVYDHLGEIFSALIFGSLIFCLFLYIKVGTAIMLSIFFIILYIGIFTFFWFMVHVLKGHVAPSSTDSGSSGNIIIDFYWVSIFKNWSFLWLII